MRKFFQASLLSAAVALAGTAAAEETFVTIGTGGQTGVYYVVGQSICKLVNRDTAASGIKCNAPSTGGSVDNLNAIAAGERQMGTVQSDTQYNAYKGLGSFEGKANDKLRAVFSTYPEAFTVVARDDSGVKTFDDLKGKRVNIGNPGSGTRTAFEALMKHKGWKNSDFAVASELKSSEMASSLCDNNLDVIAFFAGNPNGAIKEAGASCKVRLVPLSATDIDSLLQLYPYYSKVTIPAGTYEGTSDDVTTIGGPAIVVTSADVPDAAVYAVTKAVFDNLDRFKKLHPAFEGLKAENMTKDGIAIPLHDGAKKYFVEKGLIKE